MWTRKELKAWAKEALGRNYWRIVLVAALAAILTGGAGYASGTSSAISGARNVDVVGVESEILGEAATDLTTPDGDFALVISEDLPADQMVKEAGSEAGGGTQKIILAVMLAVVFAVTFIVTMAVVFLVTMLLYNPFYVGVQRFMLKSVDDRAEVKEIAYGFDHSYKNVVKTMFHKDIRVFLWALLLVIPGIIKRYQYRMVSYILAEHPNMDYKEALRLSKDMMNGEKWNAFVLDLSFIPWHLLGMITCGMVELFYVHPYAYLTNAALYRRISTKNDGMN